MKIDGYKPADTDVLNKGVTFTYETDYGTITILSKTLYGRSNPQFAQAYKGFNEWMERQKALKSDGPGTEADKRLAGIVFDHGVISWETTITSDGEKIAPTRENFVEMMSSDACFKVLALYFQDAADEKHFRTVDRGADRGNSKPRSAGK